MAQRLSLPLTVSCFSKIEIGFTFLVPAHPGTAGSTGQWAVKRLCVRVRACVCEVWPGRWRRRPRCDQVRDEVQAAVNWSWVSAPYSDHLHRPLCTTITEILTLIQRGEWRHNASVGVIEYVMRCRQRRTGPWYQFRVATTTTTLCAQRVTVYTGWQWRSFVSYLCKLVFAAIL